MHTLVSLLALGLASAGNLLDNPGFERVGANAALPAAWTQLAGEPVELRRSGGHLGPHAVRFSDHDPGAGVSLESDRVPARPGGTYHLSAWVRTRDACQPGIYIQFHSEAGDRIHEVHSRAQGPTPGWVRITTETVAPRRAAMVSALLYAYIGDVGGFDFDDVCLTVEGGAEPGSTAIKRAMPGGNDMVDIGSRLELFVDDFLVDSFTGDAERRLHHPIPQEVVFSFDAPWEGPTSAYMTVLTDGPKVRLYYRGSGHEGTHELACMSESDDGIRFTRPELGLVEFGGSSANNIVWAGEGVHNFTPFVDANPACKPEERYKAVAGGPLIALSSPDGIHWSKMREEPIITEGAFDSQNLAFWDSVRGEYVCILRDFADGVRTIRVARSKDFLNWTTPQWATFGDAPPEHLYTNATVPYFRAPHIYLAFPMRLLPDRKKIAEHPYDGICDGVFMSSRDGLSWDRWIEAFLRPGPDPKRWTDRNNHISWGLLPTSESEVSLYWCEHYRHDTCRLRRGTVRTDGFVSVRAGAQGGEILTRPLTFSGNQLVVNYATSAAGDLRFELCDEAGDPWPGFSLEDSEILFGDEIAHTVQWSGGADVSALIGRPVRLRARLTDADLYSIQFAE